MTRTPRRSISLRAHGLGLGLSLALAMPVTAGAQPSREQVREAVTVMKPAAIETMQALAGIESGSTDERGLERMARLLSSRLAALGAQIEAVPATPNVGMTLIGRLQGSGSRSIMLIAHYDTVYPHGILVTDPVRIDGRRLYGPGIADSKGGIALILHALDIIKRSGWTGYGKITVLFNPDEEIGSTGSGPLIRKLAGEHDTVLSFEPTLALRDSVLTGASGTGTATLRVKGKPAHAGVDPTAGRNALTELSHQLLQLQDLSNPDQGVALNWTVARAGDKRNVIPESASAEGDIRISKPTGAQWLKEQIESRIRSKRVPDTQVEIDIDIKRPAFRGDAKTDQLVGLARQIYSEIGRDLNVIGFSGGGTDAGFAAAANHAAVLESLGMPGMGFHARAEWVDLEAVEPRLYLATRMIVELTR